MSEFVAFHECARCGFEWETIEDFVLDRALKLVAYQPVFSWPEEGILFFRHDDTKCMQSFSLRMEKFDRLENAARATELKFMDPQCKGHCFTRHDFSPCNVECSLRWTRDVLQRLVEHRLD